MPRTKVDVAPDYVQKLAGGSPLNAMEELIWNGLDAGGPGVEVKLFGGGLGAIERIEVSDKGTGIAPSDLIRAFGTIGNSSKRNKQTNPDGRALHGKEGRGRFKALALGQSATWQTTYKDGGNYFSYSITLRREDPDYFDATEPVPAKGKQTGTTVVIPEVDGGEHSLANDDSREKLSERFAPYLLSYANASITYEGRLLDPAKLITHREIIPIESKDLPGGVAKLLVVEWNFKPDGKRIHICDERGFSHYDIPAAVQGRGIDYTAYLQTKFAAEWASEGRFTRGDLDDDLKKVVAVAKDHLRAHVRGRLSEESATVVEEWKRQQIYPYQAGETPSPLADAEQELFNIVAVQVHDVHPSFDKSDIESKRLTLALIRQAMETNPASLSRILREVVTLSEDDREALVELLDRAPLSNLIRAGRLVADRLDTVQAFDHILFDTEWRKKLLERTQLHRLLVHELWILGEEYALGTDDDALRDLLLKHVQIMGRSALSPEVDVKLINGKEGIPDLMLYRRRNVDRDHFEHLVVELKRPRELLGKEEIGQLEDYAFTVTKDERFDTKKCQWRFVLLGNGLDDYAKMRASQKHLPEGCIHSTSGVDLWVHRWCDVLNDARARYEFFRKQFAIEASRERGLAGLQTKYAHLFEPGGKRKGRDLELSATQATTL